MIIDENTPRGVEIRHRKNRRILGVYYGIDSKQCDDGVTRILILSPSGGIMSYPVDDLYWISTFDLVLIVALAIAVLYFLLLLL